MNLFSKTLSYITVREINKELHKPQKGDGKTVHLPKLLMIIGVVCTVALLIPALYMFFIVRMISGGLAFLVMSILASSMIIGYLNQRVYYDENGFVSKTFFGIKRKFSYSDIDYISGSRQHDTRLVAKGKKIHLDEIAIGKIEFIAFANRQYMNLNDGKRIPEKIKISKFAGVFKGNVRNPGSHLFIYALIPALFLAVIAFAVLGNKPTAMESLEFRNVTVQSYEMAKDEIRLNIDGFGTKPYLRGYQKTIKDYNGFVSLLNNKSEFEIGYDTIIDDGVSKYRIEYIKDKNGFVYTTPQDYYEYYQSELTVIVVLCFCVIALWLIYVVFCIYVGRNPRKFKAKLVHRLFSKGDIKI